MEKSDCYYRRKLYMNTLTVPTISEVKEELGEALAEAFFSQCPDPLKPDMGLGPPLKGAGDDLWVSPSDTLIGKVCLKPPLTNKHMKALTHEGILLIGRDAEIKFWNEAEILKQRALAEQEEVLLFIADIQKREAVKEAHKEEWEICDRAKEEMRIEFAARLTYELEQLETRLKEDYEELMRHQKRELDELWQEKLEIAVAETVTKLTAKFLEDLAEQEEELLKKFEIEIKKERIKCKMEIKVTQECCEETFLQLKHQLECKNISNMMYILCVERRKCQEERVQMEADYQKQVLDLQAVLVERDIDITKLTRDRDEKVKQVSLREECLLEILRQFQKFINFALRASPTQAEFLLNVEKMMMLELTQAVAKTDRRHMKRLAKTMFPWKSDSEETVPTASSKTSLIPDDYHNCYNEIEPPISDHSLKSADYLPAFYYDKHMYIREEFRNMMSQGIKVSPSNLIWNRDVEHLMQIFRRSVSSMEENVEEEEGTESTESTTAPSKASTRSSRSSEIKAYNFKQSRRSTVHFDKLDDLLFPKFEMSSSMQLLNIDPSDLHKELSIKSKQESLSDAPDLSERECCTRCTQTLLKPASDDYIHSVKHREESGLPLIGTINSLELHTEQAKFADTSPIHEPTILQFGAPARFDSATDTNIENEAAVGILSVKDSLIKHRMSLKPVGKILLNRDSLVASEYLELNRKSNDSDPLLLVSESKPANENISGKISKLSLSRNSLLVHKQSQIMKRHQPSFANDNIQLRKPSLMPTFLRESIEQTSLKLSSKHQVVCHKNKSSPMGSTKMSSIKIAESGSMSSNLRPTHSRLSLSRDSLKLLRSQSMLSGGLHAKRKGDSKESVEIKNEILGSHLQRLSPPISIKLDDDGEKAVKMSHIEIVSLKTKPILVSSDTKEEEYKLSGSPYNIKYLTATDSPWVIYKDKDQPVKRKKSHRDDFFTKPNVAEIVGSRTVEQVEKSEEFTIHRASSLLSIFKKHPSLVKIFSSCTN